MPLTPGGVKKGRKSHVDVSQGGVTVCLDVADADDRAEGHFVTCVHEHVTAFVVGLHLSCALKNQGK